MKKLLEKLENKWGIVYLIAVWAFIIWMVWWGFIHLPLAHGAVLQGFQGGTGISTSTSGNDNNCLQQSSSNPFLTWKIGSCGSGGSGNVVVSPTSTVLANNFPFYLANGSSTISPTSTLSISGTQLLQGGAFNASGTITQNGTAVMLQGGNISLLNNNSGFITFASSGIFTAGITINNLVAATATVLTDASGIKYVTSTITIATNTAATTFDVTSSGNKSFTLTLPSSLAFYTNVGFLTNASITGQSPWITWTGGNQIQFVNNGFVTAASSVTWTAPQTFNSTTTFQATSTFASTTQITSNNLIDASNNKYSTSTITTGTTTKSIQWIIENPTATEDDAVFIFDTTSTIKSLYSVNKVNNESTTFNWIWCSSRSAASSTCNHLFTNNVTSTATTTPDAYPTLVSFASTTVSPQWVLRFVNNTASTSQLSQTLWFQ